MIIVLNGNNWISAILIAIIYGCISVPIRDTKGIHREQETDSVSAHSGGNYSDIYLAQVMNCKHLVDSSVQEFADCLLSNGIPISDTTIRSDYPGRLTHVYFKLGITKESVDIMFDNVVLGRQRIRESTKDELWNYIKDKKSYQVVYQYRIDSIRFGTEYLSRR